MIGRWCKVKSKTTKTEITVYRKSTRNLNLFKLGFI